MDQDDIAILAQSSTIATLLPGSVFHMGSGRYAPARALIDQGAAVALSTGFNPSTSPTCNMQMVLSLACTQMRMTPAEAISAATINGAHALGCADRCGSLEAGKYADLTLFDVSDFREIPYQFGVNQVALTMKKGIVLYRRTGVAVPRELVECVPNFSEGRDAGSVEAIAAAIRSAPGVIVLDRAMDADHNRSVITFAGPPEAVAEAALRGVGRAVALIDLNRHTGVHPRIGAADVVPFVPLEGVTLEDCVRIAGQVGEEIWRQFEVPVYLYEAARRRPDRADLANVRRGQFEALRDAVAIRSRPPSRHRRGAAASHRGRHRCRSPQVPDRLQHQPGHSRC